MKNIKLRRAFVLVILLSLMTSIRVLAKGGSIDASLLNVNPPQAGQLPNAGEKPLYQFPQALDEKLSGKQQGSEIAYTQYRRILDDHEVMTLDIPVEWMDIASDHWFIKGKEVGVFIAASPDLNRFNDQGDVPGVFFGVSRVLTGLQKVTNPALEVNPAIYNLLLGEKQKRLGQCQDNGRFDYQDLFYQGKYDLYLNCARGSSQELVFVTMPAHQEIIIMLRIRVASQVDLEAASRILSSFQVLNTSLEDSHHQNEH